MTITLSHGFFPAHLYSKKTTVIILKKSEIFYMNFGVILCSFKLLTWTEFHWCSYPQRRANFLCMQCIGNRTNKIVLVSSVAPLAHFDYITGHSFPIIFHQVSNYELLQHVRQCFWNICLECKFNESFQKNRRENISTNRTIFGSHEWLNIASVVYKAAPMATVWLVPVFFDFNKSNTSCELNCSTCKLRIIKPPTKIRSFSHKSPVFPLISLSK